jgi:cytochrome c-type biogenesis protein CcmH/NrfG
LACQREPDNAAALLGLARTRYAMGNRAEASALHARLMTLDPELVRKYAYLNPEAREASRAADAVGITGGNVVWDDE